MKCKLDPIPGHCSHSTWWYLRISQSISIWQIGAGAAGIRDRPTLKCYYRELKEGKYAVILTPVKRRSLQYFTVSTLALMASQLTHYCGYPSLSNDEQLWSLDHSGTHFLLWSLSLQRELCGKTELCEQTEQPGPSLSWLAECTAVQYKCTVDCTCPARQLNNFPFWELYMQSVIISMVMDHD